MSVVAFWNDGREQTGKTLSMIAISTYLAIEHNYKILVVSTGFNDETLNNCFWEYKKAKKRNLGLFRAKYKRGNARRNFRISQCSKK